MPFWAWYCCEPCAVLGLVWLVACCRLGVNRNQLAPQASLLNPVTTLRHLTRLCLSFWDTTETKSDGMEGMPGIVARELCDLRVLRLQHLDVYSRNRVHLAAALEAARHMDALCTLRVINKFTRARSDMPLPLEKVGGLRLAPLHLPRRLRRLVLRNVVLVGKRDLVRIGQELVGLTHLHILGCNAHCDAAAAAVAGIVPLTTRMNAVVLQNQLCLCNFGRLVLCCVLVLSS